MNQTITPEIEAVILKAVHELQPFGKLELSMNQTGTEISMTLVNPRRTVVVVKGIKQIIHRE